MRQRDPRGSWQTAPTREALVLLLALTPFCAGANHRHQRCKQTQNAAAHSLYSQTSSFSASRIIVRWARIVTGPSAVAKPSRSSSESDMLPLGNQYSSRPSMAS